MCICAKGGCKITALGAVTYSLTQKGDPFGVKPEDAVLRKIMVSARPL